MSENFKPERWHPTIGGSSTNEAPMAVSATQNTPPQYSIIETTVLTELIHTNKKLTLEVKELIACLDYNK
jgi:hypothetical protein